MTVSSKLTCVAVIFCMSVSSAMAGSYYVAADFGRTTAIDNCNEPPFVGSYGCEDTASLWRVAAGYQFTPMWGAEFSYGDYGKANGWVNGAALTEEDWRVDGIQLSGIGTFPIAGGFSVIGKLGISRTTAYIHAIYYGASISQSATNATFSAGIGAQYDFNINVMARVQYESLGNVGDSNTIGTSKVTLLSAGIVYKF